MKSFVVMNKESEQERHEEEEDERERGGEKVSVLRRSQGHALTPIMHSGLGVEAEGKRCLGLWVGKGRRVVAFLGESGILAG